MVLGVVLLRLLLMLLLLMKLLGGGGCCFCVLLLAGIQAAIIAVGRVQLCGGVARGKNAAYRRVWHVGRVLAAGRLGRHEGAVPKGVTRW